MHPNLTGKIYDVIATLSAGGVFAVAFGHADVALNIVVGFLTSIFLILGIVIRARKLRSHHDEEDDGDDRED